MYRRNHNGGNNGSVREKDQFISIPDVETNEIREMYFTGQRS